MRLLPVFSLSLLCIIYSATPGGAQTTDAATWPEFTLPWNVPGNGALDISFLLDPPAGNKGFLKSEDGILKFEDGSRAKFWGVNLVAASAFPTAEQSKTIAERLAKAGCNLVRLHHMDAPWHARPIIDYSRSDSQHLNTENLDRLDHLVAELKARGIYIHLDLLVHRLFKNGDDVTDADLLGNGPKNITYTNRRLIELQKQYARDLLTHLNPYTGLRYADDPVFAIVQICNENSIFWKNDAEIPEFYLQEIDAKWNAWLLEEYGSLDALTEKWTGPSGRSNLRSYEDPAQGTVRRPEIGTWSERYIEEDHAYTGANGWPRVADHFRFLTGLQRAFLDEMTGYLRDLGVKCVIAGSNLPAGVVGLPGEARQGIVETNVYYGHPRDGFGIPNRFPNENISDSAPHDVQPWGTTVFHALFSRASVAGTPLVVTEWNEPYPMPCRAEAAPFVAAYSAYQDYDGLCLFSYNHADFNYAPNDRINSFFNAGNDPAIWGLFQAGALIFLRGDVSPGQITTDIVYSESDRLSPHQMWDQRFKSLSYVSRVRQCYVDEKYEGDADLAIAGGFTASGDLTGANHALIFSRQPWSSPYTQADCLEEWLGQYEPEIRLATESIEARFQDFIWDDRTVWIQGPVFADPPTGYSAEGTVTGENRAALLVSSKQCLLQGVSELEEEDPAWETRLALDLMQQWGLASKGHEQFDMGALHSDTEELIHNYRAGYLTINTPKTQGIVGHAQGKTIELGAFTVTPGSPFAVILLQSLDDLPLTESLHLLLTAVAHAENTGQKWTDETQFVSAGTAAVRIEPVQASCSLNSEVKHGWQGFALEANGSRNQELDLRVDDGGISWDLPADTSANSTGAIHFELQIDPSALESWCRHGNKNQ